MLETEFVDTATFYGKIIIGERFLPNGKKSIPPIDIGGVAGGIKFIVEGILFKFAWDHEGVYEGDLKAMKAASHGTPLLLLHFLLTTRLPLLATPYTLFYLYTPPSTRQEFTRYHATFYAFPTRFRKHHMLYSLLLLHASHYTHYKHTTHATLTYTQRHVALHGYSRPL